MSTPFAILRARRNVQAPSAPPPDPSGTFAVDFAALPDAARQENDWVWYRTNIKDAASGTVYTDPHSGVKVLKVSDASTPVANTSVAHAYSEGGPQMSQPWGDPALNATIYVLVEGNTWHLVDCLYNLGGDPTITNWRQPVRSGGELRWAFSRNTATPQYAYTISAGTIYRLNWQTNEQADGGIFPYVMPDQGTYGSSFNWLELSADDRYLNFQTGNRGWHFRLDQQTGTLLVRDKEWLGANSAGAPNADESHITDDGRYCIVVISASRCRWWDCETNQRSADFLGRFISHGARVRDTMISLNAEDQTRGWNVGIPPGPITVEDQVLDPFAQKVGDGVTAISGFHHSRHLDVAGDVEDQWFTTCGSGSDGLRPFNTGNWTGAWTLESGNIYRRTATNMGSLDFDRGLTIWELSSDTLPADFVATYPRIAFDTDLATTLASMTEGTCYWHRATTTLYVWARGGVEPSTKHYAMIQMANHGAIAVATVDGLAKKYVCASYTIGDGISALSPVTGFRYKASAMPHLGPAPWIMMKREHGAPNEVGARVDTFMARLPVEVV